MLARPCSQCERAKGHEVFAFCLLPLELLLRLLARWAGMALANGFTVLADVFLRFGKPMSFGERSSLTNLNVSARSMARPHWSSLFCDASYIDVGTYSPPLFSYSVREQLN